VRDGSHLWIGSANFTSGGLDLQDNNWLYLTSSSLAADYQKIFEDLLGSSHERRHTGGHRLVPPNPVTVGNTGITAYFSTSGGEDVEKTIISELRGARKIRVLSTDISITRGRRLLFNTIGNSKQSTLLNRIQIALDCLIHLT